MQLGGVTHVGNWGVAAATHSVYHTALGVAGWTTPDGFKLESFILCCEKDSDKFRLSKDTIGHRGGVGRFPPNEKMDILEAEGVVGGVCASPALFPWPL